MCFKISPIAVMLGLLVVFSIKLDGSTAEPLYRIKYEHGYSAEVRKNAPTELVSAHASGIALQPGDFRIGSTKHQVGKNRFVGLVDRFVQTGGVFVAYFNSSVLIFSRRVEETKQLITVTDRGRLSTAPCVPGSGTSTAISMVFAYSKLTREVTLSVELGTAQSLSP